MDQLEIRLYAASVDVEVEAELGNFINEHLKCLKAHSNFEK